MNFYSNSPFISDLYDYIMTSVYLYNNVILVLTYTKLILLKNLIYIKCFQHSNIFYSIYIYMLQSKPEICQN